MTGIGVTDFSSFSKEDFWTFLDRLVDSSRLVIDRPKNSSHPRYPELIYPLDYGYLEGTSSMDEGGIDVWIGSASERELDGIILTIDLKKKDAEVKILLGCTEEEKRKALDFLNDHTMRAVLVRRQSCGLNTILTRQSVRQFRPDPVSKDILDQILEAATWAPSAHNRQPWRFVVLYSEQLKARFAEAMGEDFRRDLLVEGQTPDKADALVSRSSDRINNAPLAVLLCLDPTVLDQYNDAVREQGEYLMGVQSVAMAGENLLLAAHSLGLGGVWVCAPLFTPGTVREVLNLPDTWQPQGLILLGYPAKIPNPRPRQNINEVTQWL
jgi:coenzyme F420-0:L-glutamate ligase/coenzyme F420-1:gamma-L-glutamate ligase